MRKELKHYARGRLKKVYWMMVILCLMMAIGGIDYVGSFEALNTDYTDSSKVEEESMLTRTLITLARGNEEVSEAESKKYISEKQKEDKTLGIIALGHTEGVLAELVNNVTSGEILNAMYHAAKTVTKSKNGAIFVCVILSLLFILLVKVLIFNVLAVTIKRFVLEFRIYNKVPIRRFMYLLSIRKVWNTVLTMLWVTIYQTLWMFTVVGGIIKSFSYRMVPYILAENPSITPKQAITLSRRMMNGHKWEAFKLEVSFLGWNLLSLLTVGFSGFLYSNPYEELTNAGYYAYIRKLAKENHIPDAELLNDTCLHEMADVGVLKETYSDLQDTLMETEHEEIVIHTGMRGFLEKVFGLTLFYDEDEKKYQWIKTKRHALQNIKDVMDREMYPSRLYPLQVGEKHVKYRHISYDRHYSIFSIIMLFFTMSFVGWCWEVSLHLIDDGKFVNRGVFHGPWLPIYGFGGVLIVLCLHKFRENALLEFLMAVLLCGSVEYFSAWYLEMAHNGQKWWDYNGYFLNIHGRVCAEGLLVFGLGGLAIVYLLAPFLDNQMHKIPKKVATVLSVVLLTAFLGDAVYSNLHPNTGKGITSYIEQKSSDDNNSDTDNSVTDNLDVEAEDGENVS